MLREFSDSHGAASFPSKGCPEFLWDFVSYIKERGIFIAAESEWNTEPSEIAYDFEKLLYVRSPLKLMICRIEKEEDADVIGKSFQEVMETTCAVYSPGEVFIIYCVWWADSKGENRDIAYSLQVDGEPDYVGITGKRFQLVSKQL